MKLIRLLAVVVFATMVAGTGSAAFIDLTALDVACSDGQANIIVVEDVTGNNGGATDCWGAFDGNDPGPNGGFNITMNNEEMTFNYLAKKDIDNGMLDDPEGINLVVGGTPGIAGTWEFTEGALSTDFLIVLKAANSPGYGVWLFSGPDNASYNGRWSAAWEQDLSHLAIYDKESNGNGNGLPEPSSIALIGLGLLALARLRRR